MLKELFARVLEVYLAEKQKYYKDESRPRKVSAYESYDIVVNNLPLILAKLSSIDTREYLLEGSISTGNVADIPWVCVFDQAITNRAEEGYYIVYLFKSDMTGVYLSLNQGWTQYEKRYGLLIGREKIKRNSEIARNLLRGKQGFSFAPIALLGKKALARGYEIGNICSKFYSKENIPNDAELINDLRNLLGVYRELKGLAGVDIFDIENNADEETFQDLVQAGTELDLPSGPKQRAERKTNDTIRLVWPRNPDIAFTALKKAAFKCEYDPEHITFTSRNTGKQFVEAHHLIPMEYQGQFDVSIDVPENIISLCPNCHRRFHYSLLSEQVQLVDFFFKERYINLQARGIEITIDELKKFYIRERRSIPDGVLQPVAY